MEQRMRRLGIGLCLLVLTLLGGAFLLLELLVACSLNLAFLVSAMALALGTALVGWRWLRSSTVSLAGSVVAIAFLLLRFAELNPVKPFRAFFREVRPGMSKEAVLARLERHFPPGGAFRHPVVHSGQEGRLLLTLDPLRADYNSELIDLDFENGLLVRSRYYPD